MKYKSTNQETTAQRLERIAKYKQHRAELAAKPKQPPIVPPYMKDPKWKNRLGGLNRSEKYGPEGGPLDD
jgi:nitrate reductase cytochrome c-type subunit